MKNMQGQSLRMQGLRATGTSTASPAGIRGARAGNHAQPTTIVAQPLRDVGSLCVTVVPQACPPLEESGGWDSIHRSMDETSRNDESRCLKLSKSWASARETFCAWSWPAFDVPYSDASCAYPSISSSAVWYSRTP
jgi:hypothetical protein